MNKGLTWGFADLLDATMIGEKNGKPIWRVNTPLIFVSFKGRRYVVPVGFQTDFASVPRLPIVYMLWGDRAHREAVLHDWAFRKDSGLSFRRANDLFFDAMSSRNVASYIKYPMWSAVCSCGKSSYHKLYIMEQLVPDAGDGIM
jgi:hypothetical protein